MDLPHTDAVAPAIAEDIPIAELVDEDSVSADPFSDVYRIFQDKRVPVVDRRRVVPDDDPLAGLPERGAAGQTEE